MLSFKIGITWFKLLNLSWFNAPQNWTFIQRSQRSRQRALSHISITASSLQHNFPRSFYLVLVFWNLLQIIQLSICDIIVIVKKGSTGGRNSHFVGGVKSFSSHSFLRHGRCYKNEKVTVSLFLYLFLSYDMRGATKMKKLLFLSFYTYFLLTV